MSEDEADAVVSILGLDSEVAAALQEYPMRGSVGRDVPTDPTIYRIHEITQIYGTTIKALIHAESGDGIMSAIRVEMIPLGGKVAQRVLFDLHEEIENAASNSEHIEIEGMYAFAPELGVRSMLRERQRARLYIS